MSDFDTAAGKSWMRSKGTYTPPRPPPRRAGSEQAAAFPSGPQQRDTDMSKTDTFFRIVRDADGPMTARQVYETDPAAFGGPENGVTAANIAGLALVKQGRLQRTRDEKANGVYVYPVPGPGPQAEPPPATAPEPEPPAPSEPEAQQPAAGIEPPILHEHHQGTARTDPDPAMAMAPPPEPTDALTLRAIADRLEARQSARVKRYHDKIALLERLAVFFVDDSSELATDLIEDIKRLDGRA